ncbi:hypothetical protein [Rubritalea halochordaticola]|uniref:hypothetical protein n=1 Tax=Rubritalea halochordaticola TaxID=714537 RepID=UPI0031FDB033
MSKLHNRVLSILILPICFLTGVARAAEFKVYRVGDDKKIVEAGSMQLRAAKSIQQMLGNYHRGSDFAIPKEGISAEEGKKAVAAAKKQLLANKAKYEEVMKEKANMWHVQTSTILQANEALGGILAAYGGEAEIAWLNEQFPNHYWVGAPIVQIRMRHGKGFDTSSPLDFNHVQIARVYALKRDQAAVDWLYKNREKLISEEVDFLYDLMKLMALNKHPQAESFALECLKRYQEKAVEENMGDSSKIGYDLVSHVPWAVAYLAAYAEEAKYKELFEGLKIHANMRQDIMLMISVDPTVWLDCVYGKPGANTDYQRYMIKEMKWDRSILRAAFVKRSADQAARLEAYIKASFSAISKKHNLFQITGRADVSLLFRETMAIDLSPLRVSSVAALYAQLRSNPNWEVPRAYLYTPWVKMEWYPKLIAEILGDRGSIVFNPYRLSPYDHEEIKKTLLEGKMHLKCAVDSVILWQQYINNSFKPPIEYQLGGIHSPVLRLPGDMSSIGMHSFIRTIAKRGKGTLLIGIKVETKHRDEGGLASAIAQLGEKMKPYYEKHGLKQISNLRWQCGEDKGTLEYLSTSESGLHFFKGTFTRPDMRDVHLYFDWNSPGKTYVLAHALYEPEFGLTPPKP